MSYTLVATAKNEGPYLLEWVAYHWMIGFDNILIFQNDSDDYTDETLRILDELGIVQYRYNRAPNGHQQVRAYKRAARQESFKTSDWALALDLDEFLHIHVGKGHLDDLFTALPDSDIVLLNWRYFGHGDHDDMADMLVTERFQSTEYDDRITEVLTAFKAMFRPSHFDRCGVHKPPNAKVPPEQIRTCNGSGLMEGEFERKNFRSKDPERRKLAQVNHYITRDAAGFVLKSHRGSAHQADRGIDKQYWQRRNFNDTIDTGLAARSAETLRAMADLNARSEGRLEELRIKSLNLHQERFKKLLKEPVYKDLYEFCTNAVAAA